MGERFVIKLSARVPGRDPEYHNQYMIHAFREGADSHLALAFGPDLSVAYEFRTSAEAQAAWDRAIQAGAEVRGLDGRNARKRIGDHEISIIRLADGGRTGWKDRR